MHVDLYEVDGEFTIEAEVPGIPPGQIELLVSGDKVSIRGRRDEESQPEGEAEGWRLYRRERRPGTIEREIPLPLPVVRDSAVATLRDGVLTIRMVIRKQPAIPRPLAIQTVGAA